jgi:hypothetical protein
MRMRTNAFFPHGSDVRGSAEPGPDMLDPSVLPADAPPTAAAALAFIEREYRAWRDALTTLDDDHSTVDRSCKIADFPDVMPASAG